jgi:sulfur-oxidizing protein SoxY
MTMQRINRRGFLTRAAALGVTTALATTLGPHLARAEWMKAAFETKTLAETYKALGAAMPSESGDVQILASDIAENGAVVPIQAVSKIAGTTRISILVEKNPSMLAALFEIGPDMVPDVTTRIKMGQTSNVIVLVEAGGKAFTATKEIKVTLGGCGG